MSPRVIVKEKVAIFIIATIVLLLNLVLLLDRIFNFLIFLGVLFLIFVFANVAFRSIDRRRQSEREHDKSLHK
jgi:L-asparagine transporter-like permease